MKTKIMVIAAALAISGSTFAALSADEIKQLGTTLTPWGAIKAGNKEGTIPAYDGGLPVTTSPPGFKKDSGRWVDPYANEKPLYSITAKNLAQYDDKLSETTKELLRRFPATYRVDVYPTHRTVNYTKNFIDASLKNAERCHTIDDGVGLKGCVGGMAFPIPKTGNEAMWNIQTAQRSATYQVHQSLYIDSTGAPVVAAVQEIYIQYPYNDPKQTLESFEKSGSWQLRASTLQKYPPRIAGDGTTLWNSLDPNANSTKGWNYQQGNRRVRSIPDAQYDYPVIVSGGAMFFDEINFFSGKLDRFDWKLLGKKEMLIPYNAYKYVFNSSPEEIAAAGGGRHPNPDLIRWELHRVNVVEGTLKPGARHAFAKRRYYIDEDHPSYGMADAWDHAGKIYKGFFSLATWAYDYQTALPSGNYNYDLSTGISFVSQVFKNTPGVFLNQAVIDSQVAPEAMQRRSAR
jgi:hypothetical protein